MTGTWRDTLFVWHGPLSIDQEKKVVDWKGNWIGCEECPDANDAELPIGFTESDMGFEVSGTIIDTKGDIEENPPVLHISMTGGSGWDLEGEDQIDRHGDDRHDLLLTMVIPSAKEENDDTDVDVRQSKYNKVVAAVGENNFGPFVSAGFLDEGENGEVNLTLGRRYIEDRDERAAWTIGQLYAKICNAQTDECTKLPWKTMELHAKTLLKQKRKRKRKK